MAAIKPFTPAQMEAIAALTVLPTKGERLEVTALFCAWCGTIAGDCQGACCIGNKRKTSWLIEEMQIQAAANPRPENSQT